MTLDPQITTALREARAAEKQQARFYRALAAQAEAAADLDAAERLNGLHADEQHHLSRLSARLVELGQGLENTAAISEPTPTLETWESDARGREQREILRYEALLGMSLDERTAQMIREFLQAERRHESLLGGKWMNA